MKKRVKRVNKVHKPNKIQKLLSTKVHFKHKLHPLPIIWTLISILLLVLSIILRNKYLLYLGLVSAILTIFIIIAFLEHKSSPKAEEKVSHKEPKLDFFHQVGSKQESKIQASPTKTEQHLGAMKKFISLKYSRYDTDIDKLYRLLEKYKAVKISQIAKLFNITNEKAEQWGRILESHELIQIHYPTFGEPELRWKQ